MQEPPPSELFLVVLPRAHAPARPSSRCRALLLAVLGACLLACSDLELSVDAGSCTGAADDLSGPALSATVVHDLPLPEYTPEGKPFSPAVWGVFADPAGVSIFSAYSYLRTDPEGGLVSRAPYPDGIGAVLTFSDIVPGAGGFGASVLVDGLVDRRFCFVPLDGTFTLDDCAPIAVNNRLIPRVTWDGNRFVAFHGTGNELRAHLFDPPAVPAGVLDLWDSTARQDAVPAATAVDQGFVVLMRGQDDSKCYKLHAHTINQDLDPASHREFELLDDGMSYAHEIDLVALGAGVLFHSPSACSEETGTACLPGDRLGTLRWAWMPTVTEPPIRRHTEGRAGPMVEDGQKVVALWRDLVAGAERYRVATFDEEGNLIGLSEPLALVGNSPGHSIIQIDGLARIGENDYALVYLENPGLQNRMARIQLGGSKSLRAWQLALGRRLAPAAEWR